MQPAKLDVLSINVHNNVDHYVHSLHHLTLHTDSERLYLTSEMLAKSSTDTADTTNDQNIQQKTWLVR